VWLRSLWLHSPFRKIPVSRHPPIEFEAKSGPLRTAQQNRPSPSCFRVTNFRLSLPTFTSGFSLLLFALCLERTSSIFSQSLPRGIRSSCQIADEFEDDLPDNRVRRRSKTAERKPGVSTQDNDDLAKTLRTVQMVTTWHDADVHGDKRQHFPSHRI
jgi:hypothetical protein